MLSVVPTVATVAATTVGSASATLNAQISSTGGASITQERFSWGSTSSCSDGYTSTVTVNGNSFSYWLTGLMPSHTYYCQAWADNTAGWGKGSAVSFTTNAATITVPNAPSNLKGTAASSTQINLSWADNSNNETGFQIDRWNGLVWAQIGTVSPNVTTYTDFGRSPSTTYYYEVGAYNSAGFAWAASYATVNTPAVQAAPLVQTVAAGSVTANSAVVNGTINPNGAATSTYFQYGTTTSYGSTGQPVTGITTTRSLQTTLTGLAANTIYHYRIVASNSGGTTYGSDMSFTTSAATITVPKAPSNLTGTAISATQIKLSWTDNSNNETGFQIDRWNSSASAWAQIGTVGPNVTTYTDSGLSPSTTFYYQVAVYNSAGFAWAASYATVTTSATTVPNASPAAASQYAAAVIYAKAHPMAAVPSMASFIGSPAHEGLVLYAYPDLYQHPTIGYGYCLDQSVNQSAQSTVDSTLGAGTYQKLMSQFSRLQTAWLKTYGNLTNFTYGTSQYAAFAKANPSLVTPMVSPTDATTLLNAVLLSSTGYVASARADLGATTYDALSPAAQNAVVDMVYNLGGGGFKQTMANVITDIQGHNYAMAAWDLMNARTSSGVVWATLNGQRAIDDLVALAWGHEAELVSYS
jgi:GH24 family phage-related lysozyme (muramidase)